MMDEAYIIKVNDMMDSKPLLSNKLNNALLPAQFISK